MPVFAGTLSPAGAPIVITVSPSGSWSMLASGPDGKMLCLALSGENWSGQSPAAAPGEDS